MFDSPLVPVDLELLKRVVLGESAFNWDILALEKLVLSKLKVNEVSKAKKFPSQAQVEKFRLEQNLDEKFRERDPKDPLKVPQPAPNYSVPMHEDVPFFMKLYFDLLFKDPFCNEKSVIRSAGFSYYIFYLIHPYWDGNKRTAAFIFESLTDFPLRARWSSFGSDQERKAYVIAHVGSEHVNWEVLATDVKRMELYFSRFYRFLLNSIIS